MVTPLRIDVIGRFSDHADVDVFILHGIAEPNGEETNWLGTESRKNLLSMRHNLRGASRIGRPLSCREQRALDSIHYRI